MILQTGGFAIGETSTRSRPYSAALARATSRLSTPSCSPSGPITLSSRARMRRFVRASRMADSSGNGEENDSGETPGIQGSAGRTCEVEREIPSRKPTHGSDCGESVKRDRRTPARVAFERLESGAAAAARPPLYKGAARPLVPLPRPFAAHRLEYRPSELDPGWAGLEEPADVGLPVLVRREHAADGDGIAIACRQRTVDDDAHFRAAPRDFHAVDGAEVDRLPGGVRGRLDRRPGLHDPGSARGRSRNPPGPGLLPQHEGAIGQQLRAREGPFRGRGPIEDSLQHR